MTTTEVKIEQAMLDALGEAVERALSQSDMIGIVFLQMFGGRIAIYNPTYKNALKRRFDNIESARAFAIHRLMDRREGK